MSVGNVDSPTELLEFLLRTIREQINALCDLRREFERRPDAQDRAPNLAGWFPQVIGNFERASATVTRAVGDPAYRASPEFGNALAWFNTLGYGFDVDLDWSDQDRSLRVRNGEMIRAAMLLHQRFYAERAKTS